MLSSKGRAEVSRLLESREGQSQWKKWGPYLSERQWGTVREDYSENGNAWDYFSHDQARSRAYRWGEDGIAGISDDRQRLCFALALWNERDPILKERLFGLTNSEGNHGEDVKEYYYYLDSTPTHSYMKCLYKYPQQAYPYDDIVKTNRKRTRTEPEYELIDTGVFDDDRYFDVFVEYAKAGTEDILTRITVWNRGPEEAAIHVLPTVWFRNTWATGDGGRPALQRFTGPPDCSSLLASHEDLGRYDVFFEGKPPLLFTENDTNMQRISGGVNPSPYVKDGINNYLTQGAKDAINPDGPGTKAAAHYILRVAPGQCATVRCRIQPTATSSVELFGTSFDEVFSTRIHETDEFYDLITPDSLSADQHLVIRQALAGMLWSKQYYNFDLDRWLDEHRAHPRMRRKARANSRNTEWFHMLNNDVISMPDKWEYPWYAAWDLAFHTTALSMVDIDFAKKQLDLMLDEMYIHPNGQIPAYEWNFGDVNPPVHAWAVLFIYSTERSLFGVGDTRFLRDAFQKLTMNFTWWLNRKDPNGRNVFEGGFLGLDNIGVFDRSAPLPTGGRLEQSDGTAWMAFYSQNMLEIALELAKEDDVYADWAGKFVEHFLWIASAMDRLGDTQDEMWDEEDGFFYDVLSLPDGTGQRLKVRSLVGLLPLCAATVIPSGLVARYPQLLQRIRRFLERNPEVNRTIAPIGKKGVHDRHLLAIVGEDKLRRILRYMLDENEFFSPFGIRSLSRFHLDNPYVVHVHGEEYRVQYLPGESDNGMFGGNSNWRGPVWMPVNMLFVRALLQYYLYYGNDFKVECPTGSGNMLTLFEVAKELTRRLESIFTLDPNGRRPVFGGADKFQTDPHWRDYPLFYEYFHGDNGAGIGASHQTGWTGTVARLIQLFGHANPDDMLVDDNLRPVTHGYYDR